MLQASILNLTVVRNGYMNVTGCSEQLQRGECGERAARALRAARCVLQAWRVPHAAQLVTRALRAARPWPELVVRLYAQEPDRLQVPPYPTRRLHEPVVIYLYTRVILVVC